MSTAVELWSNSSPEDFQAVIRAVYRQVLGNAHVMESERLTTAESQLCNGTMSLRNFVRAVAKSPMYRQRFFETSAPYRFVELNFKHLLGRAPQDQAEISQHIRLCNEQGFEAEIDSYIDSEEYAANFGENIVPYNRAASSLVGQKQVGYNRMFSLCRGTAETSKASKAAQLVYEVATNSSNAINKAGSSGTSGTEKRFKIVVQGVKFSGPRRQSTVEYIVPATKMTPQIQRINRTSGRIVSITEIA